MTTPQDPNQQWAQTQINNSGGQPTPDAPFSDAQYSGGYQPPSNTGGPWAAPGAPYGQGQAQFGAPAQPPGSQPGIAPAWGAAPGAPRKSRKGLYIGLAIGAGVLVIALIAGLIFAFSGGDSGSPEATVKTYLNALASGDAKKALSVSVTPPSDKLLTDEILKKQRESAPITDVVVRKPDSSVGYATVSATYKHGDKNVDEDIRVRKSGSNWKVQNGALSIQFSSVSKAPGLSVFGVDVSNDTKIYVFPGPLSWGSSNPNISVADSKKEFPLGPEDSFYPTLESSLSDKGKQVVNTAIDTYLTNCATSTQAKASTDRPGCGQNTYSSVVPGSVRWTKPTDLSALTTRFDYDDSNKVKISGSITWGLNYTSTYSGAQTGTDLEFLTGTVDLTATTPTFTPSS